MSRLDRRTVILGSVAVALAGCAPALVTVESENTEPRGGIGGTGIVGTLTDFGSVIVNGLSVQLPADLMVETVFGPMAAERLAIGHNLTIEAEIRGSDLWAKRVALVYPLIGRLDGGATPSVAGVPLKIEQGAVVNTTPEQSVAVSGVWNGSDLVASRITPMKGRGATIAAGTLRETSLGAWSIGAVPVNLPDGAKPEDGAFATAIGRYADGKLQTETLKLGRFTGAAGPLTALSVEGFLAPTAQAPFHTIDGLGHSLSADSRVERYLGRRVLLSGSYDGLFNVEDGKVLSETLTERREQLQP